MKRGVVFLIILVLLFFLVCFLVEKKLLTDELSVDEKIKKEVSLNSGVSIAMVEEDEDGKYSASVKDDLSFIDEYIDLLESERKCGQIGEISRIIVGFVKSYDSKTMMPGLRSPDNIEVLSARGWRKNGNNLYIDIYMSDKFGDFYNGNLDEYMNMMVGLSIWRFCSGEKFYAEGSGWELTDFHNIYRDILENYQTSFIMEKR